MNCFVLQAPIANIGANLSRRACRQGTTAIADLHKCLLMLNMFTPAWRGMEQDMAGTCRHHVAMDVRQWEVTRQVRLYIRTLTRQPERIITVLYTLDDSKLPSCVAAQLPRRRA